MKQVGGRKVWTVGEIARAIWKRFEDIPSRWVEAEITNLARRGAQVYFTLVDHSGDDEFMIDASMNAIVFDALPSAPRDGALVHAYGRVEYWLKRSQVRIRVERLELAGEGLLLARIDELRRRLEREGLTADARKRTLPLLPRTIGLVTSGEGAARADFIRNVSARFPAARILVVRSLVQGENAPREIVAALRHLDTRSDVDVVVLARGGGPLEDLMAFNSESVCRAVAAMRTPVVSAIGHETDVTVCDLVADLRVSTPTKAAEAVVPDAAAIDARLVRLGDGLGRGLSRTATRARERVDHAARRIGAALQMRGNLVASRVDALGDRMTRAVTLQPVSATASLDRVADRLARAIGASIESRDRRLRHLVELHELLSPERTVSRGYVIVRDGGTGRVVEDGGAVVVDQELELQFRDARVGVIAATTKGSE